MNFKPFYPIEAAQKSNKAFSSNLHPRYSTEKQLIQCCSFVPRAFSSFQSSAKKRAPAKHTLLIKGDNEAKDGIIMTKSATTNHLEEKRVLEEKTAAVISSDSKRKNCTTENLDIKRLRRGPRTIFD